MPRVRNNKKKARDAKVLRSILGPGYRSSVSKYRARGPGWRFCRGVGDLRLDAELAAGVKKTLDKGDEQ